MRSNFSFTSPDSLSLKSNADGTSIPSAPSTPSTSSSTEPEDQDDGDLAAGVDEDALNHDELDTDQIASQD